MGDLLKGCDMNNRNKLIELFIYIVIVVVGIVLLLTGGADDKTSAEIWEVNPMLLYLTSNQKSNLIDPAVRNMTLPAKKLVGRFSLKSFVTKDMRNYANAKFFVVDAACIEESGNDFTLALQSFQMMFSARIIVILSGCEDVNGEVQRLLSIGVVNLLRVKRWRTPWTS